MKFWTCGEDGGQNDTGSLLVDMVQCEECQEWVPQGNLELHFLHHHENGNDENLRQQLYDDTNTTADKDVSSFHIPTIPCEDCRVLVPAQNWEIHRAHVCRGRWQRKESLEGDAKDNDPTPPTTTSFIMETVACEFCQVSVPVQNLELHLARACTVLHPELLEFVAMEHEEELGTGLDNGQELENQPESQANNNHREEEWACPRCTFLNHEKDEKCSMCNYSLAMAMNQEDPQHDNYQSNQATQPNKSQRDAAWRRLAVQWIPREYHQLLPQSFSNAVQEERFKQKKLKQQRKKQLKHVAKQHIPPTLPPRAEVRQFRQPHLNWLERERQQYLQLLQQTRLEQSKILEQKGDAVPVGDHAESTSLNQGTATKKVGDTPLELNQVATQPQHPLATLELLQATEQLCLWHLEQVRRTRLVEQVKRDIELLGLPRWRHHLHHLLDLYQSANDQQVDILIWELRLHFLQYATLEMMALLELAVWKWQRQQQAQCNRDALERDQCPAYRNNRDIAIICQSVLPFLGRPLTPALRAL